VYPESYPETQYTILVKYLASASTPLKQPQWRQRVSKYLNRLIPTKRPAATYAAFDLNSAGLGFVEPSSGNNTIANGWRHVQRLPLGGTFSLLEVWEDQNPRYALESEGHRDDFSFIDFKRKLLEYTRPYNIFDFEDALAWILFPSQLEGPNTLSPDYDFLFSPSTPRSQSFTRNIGIQNVGIQNVGIQSVGGYYSTCY